MTDSLSPQFGSREYNRAVASGEHPPAMFMTSGELTHNTSWDPTPAEQEHYDYGKESAKASHTSDIAAHATPEQAERIKKNGYRSEHDEPIELTHYFGEHDPVVTGGRTTAALMQKYHEDDEHWVPVNNRRG